MKVVIHGWQKKGSCVWCQREKEVVKSSFQDRILTNALLCWKCLATVVRVQSQGQQADTNEADASASEASKES